MKQLLSILFASLLLFSNMGFTISSHYCRGKLVNTTLVHGTKNKGCCMSKMDKQLPEGCKAQQPIPKKGCCENTYQTLDIADDFPAKQVQNTANPTLIAAFIYVYFQLSLPNGSNTESVYADYSPPPLEQDFQVLYQTFLI